ncbi:MAG: hypothetical protein LBC19_06935 [Tannerella sp.]|jgi:hypothetical protein|nr:hypothetical protein [Tannerella sp.]
MKKKVSISFLALAAVMTLMAGIIPHHHHKGVACVIMEHCEKDHAADDEHQNRFADNGMQHEHSCIAEFDYIPDTDRRIKCKVSSCDNCDDPGHIHIFPVPYLVADALPYLSEVVSPKPKEYGEYILFYTSADACQSHGLRAPPFIS